jgi:AcrR family transcriptional regulator
MPKTRNGKKGILEAAAPLFYKNGYSATGVDAIAKAAGVTKATLYHHFSDKEALIEAVLQHLSDFYKAEYLKMWGQEGLTPQLRLTILFDEMGALFSEEDCYGCPFINAASEYSEPRSAVRKICQAHYQFLINHLEEFAREAMLTSPRQVAEQITTVIAGTYSAWYVANTNDAAKQGKQLAEQIIALHQPKIIGSK